MYVQVSCLLCTYFVLSPKMDHFFIYVLPRIITTSVYVHDRGGGGGGGGGGGAFLEQSSNLQLDLCVRP